MSTPKASTSQDISELLAAAGFERGVSRPADRAGDGYAVIPNRPGDGIVLVNWWGDEGKHAEMLRQYAAAIEAGGYHVHESTGTAYLVVTAKTEADHMTGQED